MGNLILVRHGESEWNAKGLWTGLTDISLSENGRMEAKRCADLLKNNKIDKAYTSPLSRSKETLGIILRELGITDIPTTENRALNEKDYGVYTGKNKWDVKKEVGDEEFLKIRRSWDFQIPEGESLEDVYNRVIPYYENTILPQLKLGENVLIVAHGNSLRALIKHLENIADDQIQDLELATGEIYIYKIDEQGKVISKDILATHPNIA